MREEEEEGRRGRDGEQEDGQSQEYETRER